MTEFNNLTGVNTTVHGSEILLEVVSLNIYRTNAFRISGLPVDATIREILKQVEKIEMSKKYGDQINIPDGPFALNPAPDEEAINEAMQRLRDPERRLIDELFWFWPHQLGQSKNDEALKALATNDTKRANQIWSQQETMSSEANVSLHNLAVLYHLIALDLEHIGESNRLSENEMKIRDESWSQAFRRWRVLLEYEGFWSRFTARIKDLDDPRLSTGTTRRIRESLPLALLLINAKLAVRAAETNNIAETRRHLKIINDSGFDKTTINEALRISVEPIRKRIKTLCKTAKESNDIPEKAFQNASRLIDETKLIMSVLDAVLPAGHPTREGAHDEVALTSLSEVILYANKTEDWKQSGELLKTVINLAVSESARDRIQKNTNIFKQNVDYQLELVNCFFCKNRPGEQGSNVALAMHGNVQKTYYDVTWKHLTVTVPRCDYCKKVHSKGSAYAAFGAALGAALGLIVLFVGTEILWCVPLLVPAIIGAIIGKIIAEYNRPADVGKYSSFTEFSGIKELQQLGWSFGSKPPGVN